MELNKRPTRLVVGVSVVLLLGGLSSRAQTREDPVQVLTQQVRDLTAMIQELRTEVAQSRQETREARMELQRALDRLAPAVAHENPAGSGSSAAETPATESQRPSVLPSEDRLARLEENQLLLTERISEHYETKVESASRYRTKLSGIVMLNVFGNRGQVDSEEAPRVAQRRSAIDTAGAFGVTALQSELGFETYGPTLAGGRASAAIRFDFFGVNAGEAYNPTWGGVRLRTAAVRLDWDQTSVVVGQDTPFFSALSPTSMATLGYPAFASSGNLWTWIPQVRVEHRRSISESDTLSFQGGLIDPVPRGSGQPAYATRLGWSRGDPDNPLSLGIGAYYSPQDYGASRTTNGWAGMADWTVPFGNRFGLSGEFYRGRALGALGGAQGRSVLYSGPPSDPASRPEGLDAIGGWAQLRFKATESVEFNAAYGQDNSSRKDLRRYYPVYGDTLTARNRSELINVIYRPRTDLIFSLEYRRINSWRLFSEQKAGHMNLGVGVLF
jgi:outer membrane murein-binding lipoprotein Lpp